MWHVTAEEDIRCTECNHEIPAGTECLSQMPVKMPENFRRRRYENFCIRCTECRSQVNHPCFVRRLNHWYTHHESVRELTRCSYSDHFIPINTRVVAQKLYDWPKSEVVNKNERPDGGVTARTGAAGVAATGVTKSAASGWGSLSPETQRLFQTRGLGRGLGSRTPAMAQRFYEESILKAVRNVGDRAVREFLNGKHASHIKSVSNAPGMAKQPSNIVWENARKNATRGGRNMTAAEVSAARTANRVSAIRTGAKSAIKGGAKAGAVAAAVEAAVSVPENVLHWKRGRKSGEEATKDAAKNVATAGGVGVATFGVAKIAAMAGVGLSLGPLGTPVAVVSVGLLVWGGAYRIYKASKHDISLDEYRIYFCKDRDCKTKFARRLTSDARKATS